MAQSSGGGEIIKYGLIAVGAYLIYNWWVSQPATTPAAPVSAIPLPPTGTNPVVAGAPTGGVNPPANVVTPATPPPPAANPAAQVTLAQQLIAAAGASASGTLNADQWSFYYTNTGHTAIDGNTFSALFFPNGRPSDPTQNPQMTAAQFVATIATKGFNGFGQTAGPQFGPVPQGFSPHIFVGRLPGGQLAGLGAVRIPVPRLIRRSY